MKKIVLSMIALCASLMISCGNSEIDKINDLIVEATKQTKTAETAQKVAEIATNLQAEMDKITAESGNKITFGKDVEKVLAEYQKAAQEALKSMGIEANLE